VNTHGKFEKLGFIGGGGGNDEFGQP